MALASDEIYLNDAVDSSNKNKNKSSQTQNEDFSRSILKLKEYAE